MFGLLCSLLLLYLAAAPVCMSSIFNHADALLSEVARTAQGNHLTSTPNLQYFQFGGNGAVLKDGTHVPPLTMDALKVACKKTIIEMDHAWGVRFTRSTWFQCMFIHLCDGPVQNEEVQNEFIRTYLTAPHLNYRGRAERNESGKKDDHASTHSLVKRLSLLIHQDLKVMMFRDHKHVSYEYSQLPYLTLSGRYPLLYAIRKHRYALVNAVWSAWNKLASYTGMHLSKYPTIHFPSFGPPTGVVTSTILRDVSERMLFDMDLSDMKETRGLSPSTLFQAVAIAKLNTLKAAIIADNVAAVLSMLQIEKTFRNEQPMDYIQTTIAWSAMYGADQVKAYMSAFLVSLDYDMNDFLTVWHCAQAYKFTQIDQFFLKHWPASHWENYHIPFPIPPPEICRNTLSANIRPDLSLDIAFVLSVPIFDKPNGRQPMQAQWQVGHRPYN